MRKIMFLLLVLLVTTPVAYGQFAGDGSASDPWSSPGYFDFSQPSGNWATPGWTSPIKIGVADLHDDDGQPYLVSWGWIAKSMDMGFRLETPNGTTVGGLIGFTTAPETLYLYTEAYADSLATPMPNGPPSSTVHPAPNYGTIYRVDEDAGIEVMVRDSGTEAHTVGLPYGRTRIVASGSFEPSGWGAEDVVMSINRRPGEFLRLELWPHLADSEFPDTGLIYFAGRAVVGWFRRTAFEDEVELIIRANSNDPGNVDWIITGFTPP